MGKESCLFDKLYQRYEPIGVAFERLFPLVSFLLELDCTKETRLDGLGGGAYSFKQFLI